MKKLLLFVALAALGTAVWDVQAQTVLSVYSTGKATDVPAHVFSASATVVNLPKDARLDSLWIDGNGLSGEKLTATPTARKGNLEIGFDFPFADKIMKYWGVTAGGMVFFGEGNSLEPAVDIKEQINTKATDYVMFSMEGYSSEFLGRITWKPQPLTAGENACVRYEKVADTVFIGYENLQASDKEGNVLTFSFQYAFDQSGKLSFRPVSMEPQQAANTSNGAWYWGCSMGLVAKNGSVLRFMKAAADGTSGTARERISVTQASHPLAGESYDFLYPGLCKAVASPQVNWDYDVEADVLHLNPSRGMTWNEDAPSALFILSLKDRLEGEDLPVDGQLYANGSTLGSNVYVTTGQPRMGYAGNYFAKGDIDKLTPDTEYHLYAFPYDNTSCVGGPKYNTTVIPSSSFRTYFAAPVSVRVENLTATSADLRVSPNPAAGRYFLAFDTLQLDPQADLKIDATRTYAAGDELVFGEGETARKLKVLDPCANGTFALTGLEQGKDYYCYVWSVNEARNWYSRKALSCGVTPVRALPAAIGFASAALVSEKATAWNLPAGWEEESSNTYAYALTEDTSNHVKMLSVQRTASAQGSASRSIVYSPYVERGEDESVQATIDFLYWAKSGNAQVKARPKLGDVLLVEYLNEAGTWSELATVDSLDNVLPDGSFQLVTESFTPKKVFRFRFTVKSSTPLASIESEDRSIPQVGICGISLKASSCMAVSDVRVVDGSLTATGVTLEWTDANSKILEYEVLYKREADKEWEVYPVTRPRVQLTDLQAGLYTAMVRAYCTEEESSISQKVTFTTSSCASATSLRVTNLTDTSVDLSWKGSGLSYAVIYASRVDAADTDTLYTEATSLSLKGLTHNTPYVARVVSYCGAQHTSPAEPSNPVYFNTPVTCSAPEIKVVDGSVTWQGAAFAISAPVPDRQVRILPKDSLRYPVEYVLNTQKDTLKIYGLIDYEKITYLAMARSICTVDTSAWSAPAEFTTLDKSECGTPYNLQTRVGTDGRSATVSWTAGQNNQSWFVMHRDKALRAYDTLDVRETSVTLYGLKQNTVYVWRVQAYCDHYLYSGLASGEFSTADVSLSPGKFSENLRLRVSRNQIEIENADRQWLKTLEVISMEGKRLQTYTINSADNVFILHNLPFGPAVFRLTGEGGKVAVYKQMVK